jgi:hypothetical protein
MHPKTEVVIAVLGNNDPHYMPEVSLPWCTDLKVPGGIIAVEHGHAQGHHSPSHAVLRRRHPQARVVVYGHTHKLIIDQTELPWVINPGAAGKMRTHGGPSCLVLTASEGQEWKVQEFRFPLPP